ncbi:MAG: hypothetical protein WA718_05025 [Terriglobales bacterium]
MALLQLEPDPTFEDLSLVEAVLWLDILASAAVHGTIFARLRCCARVSSSAPDSPFLRE